MDRREATPGRMDRIRMDRVMSVPWSLCLLMTHMYNTVLLLKPISL